MTGTRASLRGEASTKGDPWGHDRPAGSRPRSPSARSSWRRAATTTHADEEASETTVRPRPGGRRRPWPPATEAPAATEAPDTDAAVATDRDHRHRRVRHDGRGRAPTGEPIRVAALTSLTGNFAPWGIQVQDGMRLAVDEINADGGVDGRPLELVVADDQSNAEEGISQIERLVEDGVVAVGGVISSDVGLGTAAGGRGVRGPAVPREGRLAGDPHAGQPLHVPHVPAGGSDGGRADPAVRPGRGAHPCRCDHRRLRLGPGDRGRAPGDVRDRPEHRAADRGRPGRRAGLHHLPPELGGARSRADRRHRPPAGIRCHHRAVERPRLRRSDHRRLHAAVPRRRRRGRRGDRTLRRLQVRRLRERGVPGPRPALLRARATTTGCPTTRSPATAS